MNSLVVFLSVVALVVAKPSGLQLNDGLLAYSSPIFASAPAAVSHQSRLDIKSSPAVITNTAVAPIARTVVAAPTVLAAPAIATAAIAPAAVSRQSRIDIKTTPAITNTVVSAPVAYSAPALAYSAPALTYSSPALAYSARAVTYNAPLLTNGLASTLVKTSYAAPAIWKSAVIGTPAFAATRLAEPAPLIGTHLIKKRSAPLLASPLLASPWTAPIATTFAAGPLLSSYSGRIGLSAPLITKAYSVHPY